MRILEYLETFSRLTHPQASTVKPTKHLRRVKNVLWLGASATLVASTEPYGPTYLLCSACLSLSLHLALVEDAASVSIRQQGLGMAEVRSID